MRETLRGGRVWATSAAAIVAVTGFAAGSSAASSTPKATKVTKIAIALPAKPTDYGWNQQGVNAASSVARSVGAKLNTISNIGYNNTQSILSQLAQGGAQFIIAHASGYDTAAKQVALRYKVPVMTYDVPNELVKGLVSTITTSAEQGGYLAGILAAKTTKTHTVGIVVSASDSNWFEMSGGFAAGVASVNKKIKVLFAEIGPASYDDSAGGKRVASTLISANADVIFGMGDDASFGYLQAVSTAKASHKVWYIGDIGNMGPIDKQHVLLSSEIWSFTNVFRQAVTDIQNGTYGVHGYNLTLANGGISMLKTSYISASTWAAMQAAKAKIISGSIKVPVALTISKVKTLVAAA